MTSLKIPDDERFPVICLGIEIGTTTGWDQWDDDGVIFYAFVPNEKFATKIKDCDLSVNWVTGYFNRYVNGEEEALETLKMLEVLA
jgi:hypothetical protein